MVCHLDFCAIYIYNAPFCQARLGTNIGKAALKKKSSHHAGIRRESR
jgi:hypothetical protein